jgi:6-pyruvoyltetrahydropterin/6-carboxytetrahydropterin synthase
MIAHSLKNEIFGPAQNVHGATYIVDAEFQCEILDEHNIVIDIGLAKRLLEQVLVPLNYQNLDDFEIFNGKLTTTEFLAYFIHQEIAKAMAGSFTGNLKITLGASHVAWASYEGKV